MKTQIIGTHIVDYSQSFEEMILAGSYDSRDEGLIANNFPIVGEGRVEFEDAVFHFDKFITPHKVIARIISFDQNNPWQPAKTENTLTYAAQKPDEQRKYPIVGLGSVAGVSGGRHVLCLCGNKTHRRLEGRLLGFEWIPFYRFLAVREKVIRS